jgi:hypothetical protein
VRLADLTGRGVIADGSGQLDRAEVGKLAAKLGRELTVGELDEAMAQMDIDGSGGVDYEEFEEWWAKAKHDSSSLLAHAVTAQMREMDIRRPSWEGGMLGGMDAGKFDVYALLQSLWKQGMSGNELAVALAGAAPAGFGQSLPIVRQHFCKQCKAVFVGAVCPVAHPNFKYTRVRGPAEQVPPPLLP